jgi:hypothetical protein
MHYPERRRCATFVLRISSKNPVLDSTAKGGTSRSAPQALQRNIVTAHVLYQLVTSIELGGSVCNLLQTIEDIRNKKTAIALQSGSL